MVKPRAFAVVAFALGCGGGVATPGDDARDGSLSDVARNSADDGEPNLAGDGQPPELDAMTFDAHVYDDAGPPTCSDVGKYPGVASCCNGAYCGGACWQGSEAGHFCVCASQSGGCAWPLVCCLNPDGCVGASACKRW